MTSKISGSNFYQNWKNILTVSGKIGNLFCRFSQKLAI